MATGKEIERLAVVETKVDSLSVDIQDVKTDVKQIRIALEGQNAFNDKRYAAKWVQTAVAFVVGLIISAVITALLTLVIVPSIDHTTSSNPPTTTTTTTKTK